MYIEEPPRPNQDFDAQFSQRERIVGSEVIDIQPDSPSDKPTVIISPGYGETSRVFEPSMRVIHELRRRVMIVNHGQRKFHTGQEAQAYMSKTSLRRVDDLLSTIDAKGLTNVQLIGHSEGGLDAVLAAYCEANNAATEGRESRIKGIFLMNTAGIIGKDNYFKLLKRFAVDHLVQNAKRMLNSSDRPALTLALKDASAYIAKNPVRAAIGEPAAIAKADVLEMLNAIHDMGVGVSVMVGVDDPVFPVGSTNERDVNGHPIYPRHSTFHTLQERARWYDTLPSDIKTEESDPRLGIDGFYSVVGNHEELHIHPDKFMGMVVNALDGLEYKRGKVNNIITATPAR